MTVAIHNVAVLGATGTLGIHLVKALVDAGYAVTAIQRKDSSKEIPHGIKSVKIDLSDKDELVRAFKGQDVVVSAAPYPSLATDKVIIDAAIAASVKRIVPSEFSTNLDTPLSRKLPHILGKVEVREYLESVITDTSSTTWTSINNGPFLEWCLSYGVLGPNIAQKKAVFHDGGENWIGSSRLCDIGTALVKILDPAHFDMTANKPVYFYSVAVSEKYVTQLAAEVTGIDFGSIEDGRITNIDIDTLVKEADEKLARGDMSAMLAYYFPMMYSTGYGGHDFQKLSWNEKLGLDVLTEGDLKVMLRNIAQESGVI